MCPIPKLAREFFTCICLLCGILLGGIHVCLYLMPTTDSAFPELPTSAPPLRNFILDSIARPIAQISLLPQYHLAVFKVALACSILVFLVLEAASWWDPESIDEMRDRKPANEPCGENDDEKLP
ncbi:hypothetical protein K438DRAFT_2022755 [Mycena galopus ATCC 62051]|nr:hypothetical protein K438DRAFT_2022755 [Mycena galopus ATCC 62051]